MASIRTARAIPAALLALSAAACDPGYHLAYGLLDADGQWAAEPRFDALHPLSESLSAARYGGRWGFVDARGEWVIEPAFDRVRDFTEGVAAVSADGGWRYVDRRGSTVIAGPFLDARSFESGMAPVRTEAGWGFVDHAGDFVIEPRFEALTLEDESDLGELPMPLPCFSEGLCAAQVESGWGYVDRSGAWVIPPVFASAGSFAEGLAPAGRAAAEDDIVVGFVDRRGEWVVEPRFAAATSFASGRAIAVLSALSPAGNEESPAQAADASSGALSAGEAVDEARGDESRVKTRVVLIDTTGREVVDLGWEPLAEVLEEAVDAVELVYRRGFEGGMVPASRGQAWGFVDRDGAWVIEPRFGLVLPFRNGVAAAAAPSEGDATEEWLDGSWGLVDRAGRWIVEPDLETVGRYGDAEVMARRFGRWGVLDADGRWAVPPVLAELSRFLDFDLPGIEFPGREGLFVGAVFANHRWTMVDRRGRVSEAGIQGWLDGLAHGSSAWRGVHLTLDQSAWGLVDRRGVPLPLPPLDMRPEPSGPYLKAVTEGRWGCLDSRARWVIPARFDSLESCTSAPVVAGVREGVGLWDSRRGWIVAPGKFESIVQAWPGVYGLQSQDGWTLHRFDRRSGRLQPITGGPYDELREIVDGLAAVVSKGRLALVSDADPAAEQFPYDEIDPIYMLDRRGRGSWLVKVRSREAWGVVDAAGAHRVPLRFEVIGEAYDGMIEVGVDGKRGIVDLAGAWLFPARFEDVALLNRNVAAFREGEKWGLVGRGDGEEIAPPRFARVQRDGERIAIWAPEETPAGSEGPALLEGRLDRRGRTLVEPLYESIQDFGPRRWLAGSGDDWVLLSKATGRPVRRLPQVVETRPLQEGRAATKFRTDELGTTAFGYLDDRGRVAIAPDFDEAGSFESGLAVVSRQGKCGVIGLDGRLLLPVESDHCTRLSDGRVATGVEAVFDSGRWARAIEAARERGNGKRSGGAD